MATGLINMGVSPSCPNGHGAMERTPGFWALSGVDLVTEDNRLSDETFALNGKGCIVKLWSCPVCKLAQIYADDEKDF